MGLLVVYHPWHLWIPAQLSVSAGGVCRVFCINCITKSMLELVRTCRSRSCTAAGRHIYRVHFLVNTGIEKYSWNYFEKIWHVCNIFTTRNITMETNIFMIAVKFLCRLLPRPVHVTRLTLILVKLEDSIWVMWVILEIIMVSMSVHSLSEKVYLLAFAVVGWDILKVIFRIIT